MKVARLSILVMLASCIPAFAESPERIKPVIDALSAKSGMPSSSKVVTLDGRETTVFFFTGGTPETRFKLDSVIASYFRHARVDAAAAGIDKDAIAIDAGNVGPEALARLRIYFGIDPVSAVPIDAVPVQPVVPGQDVTPIQPSRP